MISPCSSFNIVEQAMVSQVTSKTPYFRPGKRLANDVDKKRELWHPVAAHEVTWDIPHNRGHYNTSFPDPSGLTAGWTGSHVMR